jgi:hypothetical protein
VTNGANWRARCRGNQFLPALRGGSGRAGPRGPCNKKHWNAALTLRPQYDASLTPYRMADLGSPYAISGPAELVITNACAIKITWLTNAPITTILFQANDTNAITVSVPRGKTIAFFLPLWRGSYGWSSLPATISYGEQGSQPFPVEIWPAQTFEGPISFQLLPTANAVFGKAFPTPTAGVSYWFTEDVFQVPSSLVARLPGASRIIVEHSTDLATWESVAAFDSGVGTNSFYRLHITR